MSTMLRAFTEAVTDAERRNTGFRSGYRTSNGNVYDSYMDNASWDLFLQNMSAEHRTHFDHGGGGELREENGRPPKMASFISSSRMIYQLSRDIPGFVFEAKRPTIVGGTANLDGFLEMENSVYYVEAKLREPYSHPSTQKIKVNYKPVYTWLRDRMPGIFECVMEDCGSREMDVVFCREEQAVIGFDIKQMICHLLGIAAFHLCQPRIPDSVRFLYLLYDPSGLSFVPDHGDEIIRIYRETMLAAEQFDFELMFRHIVDYLIECHALPSDHACALKQAFHFRLCSQDTYREYFQ